MYTFRGSGNTIDHLDIPLFYRIEIFKGLIKSCIIVQANSPGPSAPTGYKRYPLQIVLRRSGDFAFVIEKICQRDVAGRFA